MQSEYVVLTKEEYRQMLEAVIRKEVEAELKVGFDEKIANLHEELDLEKSSSTYWYNQYNEAKHRINELTEQLEALKEGGETDGSV